MFEKIIKMDNLVESYFGPLSREYCAYFYFLSLFFGLFFVITLVSILILVLTQTNKINTMFIANSVFVLLNLFLGYFVNRLLNTMCIRSL